jgi:hypothetical protein
MDSLGSGTLPEMSARTPRLLTPIGVGIICAYGFLLMLPVLVVVLLVSVQQLGWQTLFFPLATFGAVTFFLPFGFGNPYVARLARSIPTAEGAALDKIIAQLTFTPRLRAGLRAWIEDADDIGQLSLAESGIVFRGDAVDLFVPYSRLDGLRLESIGWRGLFLYQRVKFLVSGLPKTTAVSFAERGSSLLPGSRAITRRFYAQLCSKMDTLRD